MGRKKGKGALLYFVRGVHFDLEHRALRALLDELPSPASVASDFTSPITHAKRLRLRVKVSPFPPWLACEQSTCLTRVGLVDWLVELT